MGEGNPQTHYFHRLHLLSILDRKKNNVTTSNKRVFIWYSSANLEEILSESNAIQI